MYILVEVMPQYRQETRHGRQEKGDKQQEKIDRIQDRGDNGQETGYRRDWRQKTGSRKKTTGNAWRKINSFSYLADWMSIPALAGWFSWDVFKKSSILQSR
jgi:hypothetical protein